MAALLVALIILGCGAYQYFKGTIFKATATIIITILASAVAFGFFEIAADYFIGKGIGSDSRSSAVVPWAQSLCFTLLFVLAFAILQTAAMQLSKLPVDFGLLPERIGRPILGIFMGLIVSGLLLTALAMAPLPNKYPYQRFDARSPDFQKPNKVLLNVDGFASGWFSLLSKGSFRAIRNPQSFAVVHPAFLDQLFLNRHNDSGDIPLIAKVGSIEVPRKNGAWHAPAAGIKDAEGKAITPQTGHGIVVVRMAILRNALQDAGIFTLGQLRLICKQKDSNAQKGITAYPIGFFSGRNQITTKKLSDKITVERSQYANDEVRKHIDFAFNVPNDHIPVALEFKQNCITDVPKPVSAQQAPPPSPFVQKVKAEPNTNTKTTGDSRPYDSSSSNQGSNPPRDPALISPPSRNIIPTLDLGE
ncbi:MAG: CvpA family protein [Planctomycetes bacterium]|nr:CvpA family protein [Planctomycetota bacterium]